MAQNEAEEIKELAEQIRDLLKDKRRAFISLVLMDALEPLGYVVAVHE